jgi:hypothetical protein
MTYLSGSQTPTSNLAFSQLLTWLCSSFKSIDCGANGNASAIWLPSKSVVVESNLGRRWWFDFCSASFWRGVQRDDEAAILAKQRRILGTVSSAFDMLVDFAHFACAIYCEERRNVGIPSPVRPLAP